ncbi:hypothetical protein AN958_10710 [Leucoagaricus sp. SymC.cos]|nr:hypothetical protein AN958_10710 [Leucoagaricus sp. SymC.cos]
MITLNMSTVESDLNTTTAQSREKQSAHMQASPPTSEESVQAVETPNFFPIESSMTGDNPWKTCLEYVNMHTGRYNGIWEEEVDKLLIFAGLLSGVVASFALEAYRNVKENPADTTALLLRELLTLQLNATNPLPGFAGVEPDPRVPVSASARRVIIYHFLSLVLKEHSKPRFRVWTWSELDSRVYAVHKQRSIANIAYGLHMLVKISPHSEYFADAFCRCIQDDKYHTFLHDILLQENKTRAHFFDNLELDTTTLRYSAPDGQTGSPEMMESQRKAYKHGILVYQILEHLVESSEQDRPSTLLLNPRLGIFLKLNRGLDLERAISCPRVDEATLDYRVPYEKKKQLLDCILEMVEKDKDYNETHLLAVESIMRLESREFRPDMEAFSRTIRTLDNWLRRREQDRNGARESALEDRVKGLRRDVEVLGRLRRMR